MVTGICPRCKKCYIGWNLLISQNQKCDYCDEKLEIAEENKKPLNIKPRGGP